MEMLFSALTIAVFVVAFYFIWYKPQEQAKRDMGSRPSEPADKDKH